MNKVLLIATLLATATAGIIRQSEPNLIQPEPNLIQPEPNLRQSVPNLNRHVPKLNRPLPHLNGPVPNLKQPEKYTVEWNKLTDTKEQDGELNIMIEETKCWGWVYYDYHCQGPATWIPNWKHCNVFGKDTNIRSIFAECTNGHWPDIQVYGDNACWLPWGDIYRGKQNPLCFNLPYVHNPCVEVF